jgi:hypothetical protein
MASRDHARGVWVNVSQWLGSATDREGIDTSQAAAGGLLRWIRTTSGWVGVVNVIMVLPDGSMKKYAEQLIPARALRPREGQSASAIKASSFAARSADRPPRILA